MTHISAIITAHREGLLAGPSIASFVEAIDFARDRGLSVEPIVVLDCADALTRDMFEQSGRIRWRLVYSETGDPGLARNRGVDEAKGAFVSFLDADDLWSYNWLSASHDFCATTDKPLIAHSEVNVIFGDQRQLWWHVDSEHPLFDPRYLRIANYWDALCFVKRDILLTYPYRQNDLAAGFAHEDWHWNCVTLAAGIPHRPVPGTVHMKRRRRGSQSMQCGERDVLPWPTELARYEWDRCWSETCPARSTSW